MKLPVLLFSTLLLLSVAKAQAPDFGGVAQKEAIKKQLYAWRMDGSGWASANGEKHEFQGTEVITSKCEGAILCLEGNHFMMAGARKIPIHSAFGMLKFDEKAKTYRMRAHLANGLENEYEFTATSNGYVWKQKHPTWGEVTYTAVFTDKTWTEYGETEKDGKKTRVYEMKLERKPDVK